MSTYHLLLSFSMLAIAIAYINQYFIRMQRSIALLAAALLSSIIIIGLNQVGYTSAFEILSRQVAKIDFHTFLLDGILSFLLFAGALSLDLVDLLKHKWEITLLATVGTIFSALTIGFSCYYLLPLLHIQLPLIYCLLFGALISPTDPIAVLSIIKRLNAPKDLETIIAGESLFNDGVGIVIFLTLFRIAFDPSIGHFHGYQVCLLFFRQAIGGIGFGLILGVVGYLLIKPLSDHHLEILITLAIPTGGYWLAQTLGVSGPLAMVAAGILIANKKGGLYLSKMTRAHLSVFWEVIDEILNALLFLMIGLEVVTLTINTPLILASSLMIPFVLLVRYITVSIPIYFLKRHRSNSPYMVRILTWGGLRGGLAVAMALAIPDSTNQGVVLTMTYFIVVFAILIQGTTSKYLIKHSLSRS